MSELRRRNKAKEHNGKPAANRKRKDAKKSSLQLSLICTILSGTILLFFLIFYVDSIPWHMGHQAIDSIAKSFGHYKPVHAVVIDAGSTGSRVSAFTFHETYFGNHLILDKQLFEQTKPGLSSYADNPQEAVKSIEKLLDLAKEEIPEKLWSSTPLILKATAGLRLLPPAKAEGLLNSIKEYFKRTPFLTNDKSVEIMDGTDEGIFSWFTVNFLIAPFTTDLGKTVAALDLGGGSTQVTFAAVTPSSLKEQDRIHKALTPSGLVPVYTHSYLGLGLMAARKELITLNQPNQQNVTSDCVNHIIRSRKFHFGGVDYFVSGPQKDYPTATLNKEGYLIKQENMPVVNFNKCSQLVRNYIATKAKAPEELHQKKIFAFSYYFDRAAEVGLISPTTGGKITVGDFRKEAESACHTPNAEQPFMCLDLTFIWILLEEGFGIPSNTDVFLFKKINTFEISWALGAAYNLLKS